MSAQGKEGQPGAPDCWHCNVPMTVLNSQLEKRDGNAVIATYFQCKQCTRIGEVVVPN